MKAKPDVELFVGVVGFGVQVVSSNLILLLRVISAFTNDEEGRRGRCRRAWFRCWCCWRAWLRWGHSDYFFPHTTTTTTTMTTTAARIMTADERQGLLRPPVLWG
jgi:hypothetical protein